MKGKYKIITIQESNRNVTAGFSLNLIIFKMWTIDCLDFELGVVCDTHWGIGLIGRILYLRWVLCIPCPDKIDEIWYKLTTRKSQARKENPLYK